MAFDVKSMNLIQQIDPMAILRNTKSAQGHKDDGQRFSELLETTETQRIERRPDEASADRRRQVESVERRESRVRPERREDARPVDVEPAPRAERPAEAGREPAVQPRDQDDAGPREDPQQSREQTDPRDTETHSQETAESAQENPAAEAATPVVGVESQVQQMVLDALVVAEVQDDSPAEPTRAAQPAAEAAAQQQATRQQMQQAAAAQTADDAQNADAAMGAGDAEAEKTDAQSTRRQVQAGTPRQAVQAEQADLETQRPRVSEQTAETDAKVADPSQQTDETARQAVGQNRSADALAAAVRQAARQQAGETTAEEGDARDGRDESDEANALKSQTGTGMQQQSADASTRQGADQIGPRGGQDNTVVAQTDAAAAGGESVVDSQRGDSAQRADQQAFVDRVIRAVRTHFTRDGGGRMTLQLEPPNLGRMSLDLRIRGGVLTASIETATEAARVMISSGLSQLRGALAEQGINVERFEVHLAGGGRGGREDVADDGETDDGRRRRRGRAGLYDGADAIDETVPLRSADLDVVA